MRFPATVKYLDMLKSHYDGASDYRIAQYIGVDKATVSKWRNGTSGMSEEMAMLFADRLGLDVVEVVTEVNRDRASSRVAREYYDRILQTYKNTAALALPALVAVFILADSAPVFI